jgi:hypothetical protein
LWRGSFGVAADRELGNIKHFGLWESPCGLAFFEPMLVGDEAFYLELSRPRFCRQRSLPVTALSGRCMVEALAHHAFEFIHAGRAECPWWMRRSSHPELAQQRFKMLRQNRTAIGAATFTEH